MKTYKFITESDTLTEKDAMNDSFKKAIAVLFQAELGKVSPADYAKAIKTIIDAGDMKEISTAIIDSVRGTVNATAQTLGIAAEATAEPVAETPAEEAAETPAEEAAEHAEGGEEAGTEAAEGEAVPAPAPVAAEAVEGKVVTESRISVMAGYYLD